MVDRDPVRYPREVLTRWRLEHENWVRVGGMRPALPKVTLRTLDGLAIPVTGGEITGTEVALFRQHELSIEPGSPHQLLDLHARVQFHEGYLDYEVLAAPPGSDPLVRHERMEFMAFASGGGSVIVPSQQGVPSGGFKVDCQRLVPGRPLRLRLRSVERVGSVISEWFVDRVGGREPLRFYIEGSFHYVDSEQLFQRYFIVPLTPGPNRSIAAAPAEENFEGRSRERLQW